MNRQELREELIEFTREGLISEWVDRIGQVAKDIGLKTELISWQGAPITVAHSVVMYAENYNKSEDLYEYIKKRKNGS